MGRGKEGKEGKEGKDGRREITFEDLAVAGDVNQALTQFYEETLAVALADPTAQGVSERQVRAWFDEELITEAGTRGLVYQGEAETGGLPNSVVKALQRCFLVRSEARGGDVWIELVHDRFVEPIRRSNSTWFAVNSNNPVSQGALAWEQAGKPFAEELVPFASKDTESAKGCSGAGGFVLGYVLVHPKRALNFLLGIAGVKWLGDLDLQTAEAALLQGNSGYTRLEQEYIMASRGHRYWRNLYRKIAWAWVVPLFLLVWFCGVALRLPTIPDIKEKDREIAALQAHASDVEMEFAAHLAQEGDVDRALQLYADGLSQRVTLAKALGQESLALVDFRVLYDLCRFGALWERGERVLLVCDQAVETAKFRDQQVAARDARGLARALTGDVPGAIEDF